jgi:tetratricopeptide (TPR) repeat protein
MTMVSPRKMHIVLLGVVIACGLWLRVAPLEEKAPSEVIGGDSREYIQQAEFFLDMETVAPGNRFPGYSFFLTGLFAALPYSHEAISVYTSLTLSVIGLGLLWVFVSLLATPEIALVVTGLAALHPGLAQNAHRGLSEELFLVTFFCVLLAYHALLGRKALSWLAAASLGLLGGWMALIRADSAYAMLPVAGMFLWRFWSPERRTASLFKVLPIAILPFLLPKLCQIWMISVGFQDFGARAGRAGLWAEFMLGRMPYQYMFYKETWLSEWLFDYHTFGELAVVGIKSSVRNFLALGESSGGQLAFFVAILGAVAYVRRQREWAIPLAIPLAILPQWALMAWWGEHDVGRYNLRVVPLMLTFLCLGAGLIAQWLRNGGLRLTTSWLTIGVVLLALSPALLPFSLYSGIRPAVDILYVERTEYLPKVSQVHAELVQIWEGMASQQMTLPDATAATIELRHRHDAYAPTHYVLGVLYMQQGEWPQATASLEEAVNQVPFFAEAAELLAEAYAWHGRRDDAQALLMRTQKLRPDYPLLALLSGQLQLLAGDSEAARQSYAEYLRLNRYQHERALVRTERVLKRRGQLPDSAEVQWARDIVASEQSSLVSQLLYSYMSLDLSGISMPAPTDQTVYYNLGICDLQAGDVEAAEGHWLAMTRLVPGHAPSWANVGLLQASRGQLEQARASWQQALKLDPEQAQIHQALQQVSSGAFDASTVSYVPAEIVLPMTRRRLY